MMSFKFLMLLFGSQIPSVMMVLRLCLHVY